MTSPGKYKRSEDFFDQKIERTSATWEQIYDNVVDYLRLAGVTLLGEETPAGGV
jgi:hypothetical protein